MVAILAFSISFIVSLIITVSLNAFNDKDLIDDEDFDLIDFDD